MKVAILLGRPYVHLKAYINESRSRQRSRFDFYDTQCTHTSLYTPATVDILLSLFCLNFNFFCISSHWFCTQFSTLDLARTVYSNCPLLL